MRKLINVLFGCSFLVISNVSIAPSTLSTKTYVGDIIAQPLFKVNLSLYFQSAPFLHYSIASVNTTYDRFAQEYPSLKKNDIKKPIYPRCNSPDS